MQKITASTENFTLHSHSNLETITFKNLNGETWSLTSKPSNLRQELTLEEVNKVVEGLKKKGFEIE